MKKKFRREVTKEQDRLLKRTFKGRNFRRLCRGESM